MAKTVTYNYVTTRATIIKYTIEYPMCIQILGLSNSLLTDDTCILCTAL